MTPATSKEALQTVMETELFLKEFAGIKPVKSLNTEEVLRYIYESEKSYAAITMELQQAEFAYYVKHGITLSEAAGATPQQPQAHKNWLNRIVDWFRKQLDMLGAIYTHVIDAIEKLDISNKIFVSKYKQLAKDSGVTSIIYNGYSYKDLDKKQPTAYKVEFNKALDSELPDGFASSIRMKILKSVFNIADGHALGLDPLNVDSSKLSEICKTQYQGQNRPTDQSFDIAQQFSYIDGTNSLKKSANKVFKPARAQLAALVKYYENLKNNPSISCSKTLDAYTEAAKFNAMLINVSFSEYIMAIIARCRQAKYIIREAIGKAYKESAELDAPEHIALKPTTVEGIFDKMY